VVESPLWSALGQADRDALFEATAKTTPVGHTGRVDEIARAYVYCMEQTYATGAIVPVDGGSVLV